MICLLLTQAGFAGSHKRMKGRIVARDPWQSLVLLNGVTTEIVIFGMKRRAHASGYVKLRLSFKPETLQPYVSGGEELTVTTTRDKTCDEECSFEHARPRGVCVRDPRVQYTGSSGALA